MIKGELGTEYVRYEPLILGAPGLAAGTPRDPGSGSRGVPLETGHVDRLRHRPFSQSSAGPRRPARRTSPAILPRKPDEGSQNGRESRKITGEVPASSRTTPPCRIFLRFEHVFEYSGGVTSFERALTSAGLVYLPEDLARVERSRSDRDRGLVRRFARGGSLTSDEECLDALAAARRPAGRGRCRGSPCAGAAEPAARWGSVCGR